ncbi:MAG: hypothetical protein RR140_03580 [Clostridia bacterium]
MKKRAKVVSTIVLLALAILTMCYGVFSATSQSIMVSNSISFTATEKDIFVEITSMSVNFVESQGVCPPVPNFSGGIPNLVAPAIVTKGSEESPFFKSDVSTVDQQSASWDINADLPNGTDGLKFTEEKRFIAITINFKNMTKFAIKAQVKSSDDKQIFNLPPGVFLVNSKTGEQSLNGDTPINTYDIATADGYTILNDGGKVLKSGKLYVILYLYYINQTIAPDVGNRNMKLSIEFSKNVMP